MAANALTGINALRAMTRASEQLNYPGANKLYSHLRNEDERVLYKDVAEYVERQPHRQVFAQPRNVRHPRAKGPRMKRPPNMTQGRVPAIDLNDRWMADLADLTAQPSIPAEGVNRGGGVPYQYILVVLNVFSKELYARPLQYKSPEAVVAAFREIAHGQHLPSRLDTDAGAEFGGPFAAFLETNHIWHVVKDTQDANTLAPVDRVIGTLKRAIFRRVVAEGDKDWAEHLQTVVKGYNETVHGSLQGRTPEEVPDDQELQFALRRANSEAMVHNANVLHARDDKLNAKGAFRVQDANRAFGRSYQPRYGDAVHEVAKAERGYVTDEAGNVFKSRHTLAVPSGSADVTHTEEMRGGSAQTDRIQRETVAPFKRQVLDFLGDGPKWIHELAEHMKAIGMQPLMRAGLNYKKALLIFGLRVSDRGEVTVPTGLASQDPPPAVAPPPPDPEVRRFRIRGKQPPMAPAAAAAALAVPRRRGFKSAP